MFKQVSYTIFFFFLCFLSLVTIGASEDNAFKKGDLSISLSASKSNYFSKEFELFAPISLPFNINFAPTSFLEIGALYIPTFFNDRSSVDLGRGPGDKNQSFGGIQAVGLNNRVVLYNFYGFFSYADIGVLYSKLNKKHWKEGVFLEKKGEGIQILGGVGIRYQLGDEYGELYPWFFELSGVFSNHRYEVYAYKLDNETQPRTDSNWDNLNFISLDVNIKFGYRFRK